MTKPSDQIRVVLEAGAKRVFASALDWPGWARGGRDEASVLRALFDYGPRYQRAIESARLGFHVPGNVALLTVVERLSGDSSTDFGVPGIAPQFDSQPVDATALRHLQSVLDACWKTFATVIETTGDRPLRKGPRGGGRDLARVFQHVVDVHYGYLGQINWRGSRDEAQSMPTVLEAVRTASADALTIAATGNIPAVGPRGGVRWTVRYFVRRAAWHILDHVWEIEDRVE